MLVDPHDFEEGLDDPHSVFFGLARLAVRLLALQPDHHADRLLVFDGDGAHGIERIHEAGVLDEEERAAVAEGKARADRDAFIFLANSDQPQFGIVRNRAQEALAGDDVRDGDDEFDAARLERGDDPGAAHARTAAGKRFGAEILAIARHQGGPILRKSLVSRLRLRPPAMSRAAVQRTKPRASRRSSLPKASERPKQTTK